MRLYCAPLEGVTDGIYRRVHHDCFEGVDKYFIPFICPTVHLTFTPKERRALSPEENAGVPVVPQILTKTAAHFLWMAGELADMGYDEINLNMGCPSGTVTAKGKGAGLLRDLPALRAFLDEIFARAPLPVSVKTRVGFESAEEWPALLDVLKDYPLRELTLHPRTREEYYSGAPHRQLCQSALDAGRWPVVYNGDLFTAADCRAAADAFPGLSGLMMGRGLVANPALAREAGGGARLTKAELRAFHDRLFDAYTAQWPKNAVVGHMHEIAKHMLCCFGSPAKPRKALRKAMTVEAYLAAVDLLFDGYELCDEPGFAPEDRRAFAQKYPNETI